MAAVGGRRSGGVDSFGGQLPRCDWSCNAREPGNGQVAWVGEDTRPGVFPEESSACRPFSIFNSVAIAACRQRKRIAVAIARVSRMARDTSAKVAGRRRGLVGIRAETSSVKISSSGDAARQRG